MARHEELMMLPPGTLLMLLGPGNSRYSWVWLLA